VAVLLAFLFLYPFFPFLASCRPPPLLTARESGEWFYLPSGNWALVEIV